MATKRFRTSANPEADKSVLERAVTKGSVKCRAGEPLVEAEIEGEGAKELDRPLLSALRGAEKRTRLRAEWASEDGTKRPFDHALRKTTRTAPSP